MRILAIETSCDETSVAVIYATGSSTEPDISIRAHNTSSQIKIHQKFGGVVPNLASREHQKNLVPILIQSLKEARMHARSKRAIATHKTVEQILVREQELLSQTKKYVFPLRKPDIDAIAVTVGPGLEPALWVGINFAHALSTLWNLPIIPVNHMEGHIFSALLETKKRRSFVPKNTFPMLALLVSGGHTELILIKQYGSYTIVGETLDDAAGEAFDKTARLLELRYPGGPEIAAYSEKKQNKRIHISLPRPMLYSKDFNFSFSGLKTAALYAVRDLKKKYSMKDIQPVIAKEFQDAAVEVLVSKTMHAARHYNVKKILIGGGVSANRALRDTFKKKAEKENMLLAISPLSLTGDNALMIAIAAFFNKKNAKKDASLLKAHGQLRIT
ncbi:MAG: tRNA (adenosine(37)-N6)-threonylcarbamoyltransferase complex transferase subunit TsaD [Candidatus Niyogibacteria bacterium CG10_big_fil_rev_8_21_14_0_10_46_36]|uniref:tRNA N6-adenosine threonylcarbamoyltransferase n=1 Tax=Candidatus Niyogibacteria bacterium CG10_big_fil_rev_8_21_14_0_10_46_36 TaxID=1974726 RepID=A0A2H0TE65_9BACT|nr:MAG: tRNA (adenosine(37)-N6)-threonylcarbamoyltransferase complex transferase subunit TsaD [Candidatus Niyogibacteria bacterium CG10_big_fil_rev_8_21_14_0_10_46_36]